MSATPFLPIHLHYFGSSLLGKLKTLLIYKQSKLIGFQIYIGLVVISDGDLAVAEGSNPADCLGW